MADRTAQRTAKGAARPPAAASGLTPGLPLDTAPGWEDARERIPPGRKSCSLTLAGKAVRLTNLDKPYFPERGYTKGDLLRYYLAVAEPLLVHLSDRAMVMKRYPNGIHGKFFFMKRTPGHRPDWLETCAIEHASGSVIDFPVVRDLPSLLWIVNLGCIDLNPWYARCDDVDRPDYLHFDLDPVEGEPPVPFARVREAGLVVRAALEALGMKPLVKTTGSRGLHVYVGIERGPTQKQVWTFAKAFAQALAGERPELLTAEYRVAWRPPGRVLVDYNQNAWGRTLASVYSVRPKPAATVSAPVTWDEIEAGVDTADFRLDNLPARLAQVGDLWRPLSRPRGRFRLERVLGEGA
ncbi:MAG TPA: non-homologous end-joining DNA ligase [Thermoanaerobaculia bacterium]|nr:non-homologous end-joining DNA ligase [Thermoanaerobaculia bacterium]